LALEVTAALQAFTMQYKLCRYERMAFSDRRAAIVRRQKERGKADQRAAALFLHQRAAYGGQHHHHNSAAAAAVAADRMAREAAFSDDLATDAVAECEEIGNRLVSEVNRVAFNRKIEWSAAVKVIASSMKEAASERVGIWEASRETFLQAFPEYNENGNGGSNVPLGGGAPSVGGGPSAPAY
jgi:hypothetical protein